MKWLPWALWAGSALVCALTARHGIQPNDEGLMLQAVERIVDGQVPYRDFWWFYPPGQPYLLTGLHELTGPSLLTWRTVRVLADASVAVLMSVHNALPTQMILRYGSEELRQRFLKPMARGEMLGAFALSEPEAGSDAASLRAQAVRDGFASLHADGMERVIARQTTPEEIARAIHLH